MILSAGSRGIIGGGFPQVASPREFVVPNGLIGYWGFDADCVNPATGVIDLTGNGSAGTFNSPAPTLVNGVIDGALNFTGTGTCFIDIGQPAILEQLQLNMTICGWFNQNSSTGFQTIYSGYSAPDSGNVFAMVRMDSGTLAYYTSKTGSTIQNAGSFTPTLNTWHFFAVTVSGTLAVPILTIYLDRQIQSFTLSALDTVNSVPIRIGASWNSAGEMFIGQMDDLRIYNRAIDPWEVIMLYQAGLAGLRAGSSYSQESIMAASIASPDVLMAQACM